MQCDVVHAAAGLVQCSAEGELLRRIKKEAYGWPKAGGIECSPWGGRLIHTHPLSKKTLYETHRQTQKVRGTPGGTQNRLYSIQPYCGRTALISGWDKFVRTGVGAKFCLNSTLNCRF